MLSFLINKKTLLGFTKHPLLCELYLQLCWAVSFKPFVCVLVLFYQSKSLLETNAVKVTKEIIIINFFLNSVKQMCGMHLENVHCQLGLHGSMCPWRWCWFTGLPLHLPSVVRDRCEISLVFSMSSLVCTVFVTGSGYKSSKKYEPILKQQ